MKLIEQKLPAKHKSIELEIFADLHIGSKKCNMSLINERIKRVKENDNVYCILLGDIINNSTKTSVGDVYEEPLSPMEQMKLACSLFEPIKDKILAITAGNHERRSYRTEGTDLTWFLARQLGKEDCYDYAACVLLVRFGANTRHTRASKKDYDYRPTSYSLYISHGDGQGGITMGAKANGLQRRGSIIDADVIVTGHTHQPLTFRTMEYRIRTNGIPHIEEHEQVYVNASSTLEYEEYAEIKGMRPSSVKSPVIVLYSGLPQGKRLIDVRL